MIPQNIMDLANGCSSTSSGQSSSSRGRIGSDLASRLENLFSAAFQEGDEENGSFSLVLRQVAESNEVARRSAEELLDRTDSSERSRLDRTDNREHDWRESTAVSRQAAAIVKDVLVQVSELLNVRTDEGMQDLDVSKPDESLVPQLAEIVHALEQISRLMTEAINQGQAVEISGKMCSPEEMVRMQKALRVQVLHMEVAFNMLGISGDVAASVAGKNNVPADAGIPMATDPQAKSLSQDQLQQVFKNLIETREGELRSLLEKVYAFLKGQEQPASLNGQGTLVAKSALDVGAFDSMILRKLLKIDAAGETKIKNLEAAASTEKMDLPKVTGLAMGKELMELTAKTDQMQVVGLSGKQGSMDVFSSVTAPRLTDLLAKGVEQNVMTQIIDKVNLAVRTGVHEMRLVLNPESLGQVRIKIEVHKDMVTARIAVENLQVKQIVESNLQQLKSSLAEHNLQTGSFSVTVDSGSTQDQVANSGEQGWDKENRDGAESEESEAAGSDMRLGEETGRRYGGNSVEFFA